MDRTDFALVYLNRPPRGSCPVCLGYDQLKQPPGYYIVCIITIKHAADPDEEFGPACGDCAASGLPALYAAMVSANALLTVAEIASRERAGPPPVCTEDPLDLF
jgi:hypothetical protein